MAVAPEPSPPGEPRRSPWRPRRSPWRVVAYVAAAIVVAVVGVVVLVRVRAARTIDRYRAEVEAAVAAPIVRTRAACWGPVVPGDAAEAWERALTALAAIPSTDRDRVDVADDPDPGASAEDVAVAIAARDAVVDAHPEVAEALLEVPRRSARGVDPRQLVFRVMRPGLEGRAGLERWVLLGEVPRRRARGDVDGAFRLAAALLVADADLDRAGDWIGRSRGDDVAAPHGHVLQRALEVGGVRPARLADAVRALATLDAAAPSWADVAAEERLAALATCVDESGAFEDLLASPGWRSGWSSDVFRAQALLALDDAYRRLTTVVRDPSFPGPASVADVQAVVAAVEHPIAGDMLHMWAHDGARSIRAAAWRRVGRAALAVAAYLGATGRAPASLEALVPTYLAAVPRDPWDGAPLRYAAGPPPRVWSIGEDRVDGGGARPTDPDADPALPDLTFVVGPPADR